jgi:hypothetical protein
LVFEQVTAVLATTVQKVKSIQLNVNVHEVISVLAIPVDPSSVQVVVTRTELGKPVAMFVLKAISVITAMVLSSSMTLSCVHLDITVLMVSTVKPFIFASLLYSRMQCQMRTLKE